MDLPLDDLRSIVDELPYPVVFATLSGAHLYGFPSADSDFDVRAAHILPLKEVIGLFPATSTLNMEEVKRGLDIDLGSHDIQPFCRLLLSGNGNTLEQLFSPVVVRTSAEHEELKGIAAGCVTRKYAQHYLGFASGQWRRFLDEHGLKQLLYAYRVLLTGTHLMRTGEVDANLPRLAVEYALPHLSELIEMKIQGTELVRVPEVELDRHDREYERLASELEKARDESSLVDEPPKPYELNDLVVRVRMRELASVS
jgi:uncharacterized protein